MNSSLNITQSLFQFDEKLMTSSNSGTNQETPAYLNQARMSTYFQDNPFPVLSFANNFGLRSLGGPINYSQTSGAKQLRPQTSKNDAQGQFKMSSQSQNFYANSAPAYSFKTNQNVTPVNYNGMLVPQFMVNKGTLLNR
jgi:hypothetical protein